MNILGLGLAQQVKNNAVPVPVPDLGWYKFEGNLNDSSGRGKTLTQEGSLSYTAGAAAGMSGITGDFNASNYLYNTTFLGDYLGTSAVTFNVWFSQITPSTVNYDPTIIAIGFNTGGHFIRVCCDQNTGFYEFMTYNNSTWQRCFTTTDIADGSWHMLTAVRETNLMTLYLDGSYLSGVTVGTTDILGSRLYLGNSGGGAGDYLNTAKIGETKIYGRALSAAQITALYPL